MILSLGPVFVLVRVLGPVLELRLVLVLGQAQAVVLILELGLVLLLVLEQVFGLFLALGLVLEVVLGLGLGRYWYRC